MRFTDGGRVSWSKADRARAKKEGRYLFVIGFVAPDGGEIISMGGCDKPEAEKVGALISFMAKRPKAEP